MLSTMFETMSENIWPISAVYVIMQSHVCKLPVREGALYFKPVCGNRAGASSYCLLSVNKSLKLKFYVEMELTAAGCMHGRSTDVCDT